MSSPYAPIPARVNPVAQRPVVFGVMLFFVMLGVRWLLEQLRGAWADASAREDLVIRVIVALAASVVCTLIMRRPERVSA